MDKTLEAIRCLAHGKQPALDISKLLYTHKCHYLLSKMEFGEYTEKLRVEKPFSTICVKNRFAATEGVFKRLKQSHIPYAVVKGAVLSNAAYGDPFGRFSGDIDLLICRDNMDTVKEIMAQEGFSQGKVTDNGVEEFTRQQILFQTMLSHQTAPFIKKTANPICPYVNVDLNLNIFWGESETPADMNFVLQHTECTEICEISIQKLTPEMEFIALALHHYKDLNSIYLLYSGSLKLGLFCDIYFYIKNNRLNQKTLLQLAKALNALPYLYYCLYYTAEVFADSKIKELCQCFKTPQATELLNTFGLNSHERKHWEVDFYNRLFNNGVEKAFANLTNAERDKIKKNISNM